MPNVTFVTPDQRHITVAGVDGDTLMRTAVANDVPGIDAVCGGVCACATCHVYVAAEWADRLPSLGSDEADMLECAPEQQATSRLSCQIVLSPALDGLVVSVPVVQA